MFLAQNLNSIARTTHFLFGALALHFGVAAASAAPATLPTGPTPTVTEKVLYDIPVGAKVADTIASPDGKYAGCVELMDGKFAVAINGVRTKPTEWVVGRSLTFSPDSAGFSYQTQHDGLMFAAFGASNAPADAVEEKGYFLVGRVLFSPDGKRHAYWAKRQKGSATILVVDGKEGPEFDDIHEAEVVFSPDSKRLAYRAVQGGKQLYVLDGVPGRAYDAALGAWFSSDSSRFGYRAKVREETFVVVDGREGPRYDVVAGFNFAPGGRRFAYAAGKGDKQMLVVDAGPPGKPAPMVYKPYDGLADVAFSPDGRRLGIVVQIDKQWRAVIDGVEQPPFEAVGPLLFSPDSKRVAYVAKKDGKQMVVIDGKPGAALDAIGIFVFSPDSSRMAYAAVKSGEKVLIADERILGPAGLFAFSPDGRHIAHAIVNEDEKWAIAVDGTKVGTECDGFPVGSRLAWDSASMFRVVLGKGPQLLRTEVVLPK